MIFVLLLVHGLVAVALLGALTHQMVGQFWGVRGERRTFVRSLRGVRAAAYPNAIVALYVTTFVLGALIYPDFRVDVRTIWDMELPKATGSFEIKEHFGAIGLAILPAYWYTWCRDQEESAALARSMLTLLLTMIVWSDFLLGHVLNNLEGLS
jgi:hypothetical protein